MSIVAKKEQDLTEGQNPSVSVIVRTKDRPELLKRALQSIAAQDYRHIEVVLVNDGGCDLDVDELRGSLRDIFLNYIRLDKNFGRAHAGNVGIENAKGKYIGFLDDDDEYYPNHLATLVSFLERSDYKVAYTDSLMVHKKYNSDKYGLGRDVKKEVVFSYDFNYDRLIFENYIPFMCLLFERKVLITSGGFNNSLDLYEDWDLLIRIGKKYPFHHIKEVTANYNQWSADFQISQANRDQYFLRQAYLKVLSRHIKEITPTRIHGIISEYANARQVLKGIKSESDSQKNLLSERDARINGLANEVSERDARINALSAEVRGKDTQINNLNTELNEMDSRIDTLRAELSEKGARLNTFTSLIIEKEAEIAALKNAVRDRDGLIAAMRNTRGWRVLEKYRKIRDGLFGPLFGIDHQKGTGRSQK